jgi:acetyl esterase/lipase
VGRAVVRVLAAAAVAIGAGVARQVARTRQAVSAVSPELRSPLLYLPMDVSNRAVLQVGRKVTARTTPIHPGIACTTRTVPGEPPVPVVTYERPDRARPSGALLWIHGGGTVMGSPTSSHAFCSRVADELDALVVSVDYRLAPEDPFPAGLLDCAAALRWLHDSASSLGVDPGRVAIGGESAGGGLAASLAQHARDTGGPPVAFQLLVYPMLDDRTVLRSEADGTEGFIWTRASNRFAWTAYLGHEPTLAEERPYAAAARCTDVAGLPPAWIGVGDLDLFLAEDVDYAERLVVAGVACELHLEPAMYHGADAVLPHAPTMQAFRDRMVAALAPVLGPGT